MATPTLNPSPGQLANARVYRVGGTVRDALSGIASADVDWVVVGSSPKAMLEAGYIPVGRDFPVFLHPQSRDEYALARTERKTQAGYHGFVFHTAPDVTLEQDLARRDLSINAMAQSLSGSIIDPFGGQADLKARVLRHTGPAFTEDPVRILRIARFAARFTDFSIHPGTLALMQSMVQTGEVDTLVPERVWQELSRGLMEAKPSRMLQTLRDCGALQRILPEVDALWGVPQRADYHPEIDTGAHLLLVLDMSARLNASLAVRFAALVHDLGKGNTPATVLPRHTGHEKRSADLLLPFSKRLAVPTSLRELALVVALEHGNIHRCLDLNAVATLHLLQRLDALRRPERLPEILLACECDARGRKGLSENPYPQAHKLTAALTAAQSINSTTVAKTAVQNNLKGAAIGTAIATVQADAIASAMELLAGPVHSTFRNPGT